MNRKLISLLIAFTLVTALLAPCGTQAYAEGETYTYHGTYSGVSTWSPTDWEISSEYDMLGYTVTPFYGFWMNETRDGYDIVPELAAEFPVDVTAAYAGNAVYGVPADATEGYAWQVKMRDNATWEDGTPITARDVEYTLQQFLSPDMKNYRASLFYQSGTALANAESYYNSDKAGGIIKSAYGTGVDKFSSYGPYKLTGYQEFKQIVFARNESWFGYADERYEGMYQTTGVELSQIDEHTTQLTMFLQGNLDAVGLAADDMEKYGTSDYVYYTPTSNTYYLALNTDFDILKSRETEGVNKTILTYIDFRKAMSLSFDRTDYVMSCTSCSDPAFGLLNGMYVCAPVSGLAYRDSEYAQRTLCEVYGVDSVDDLTGYNRDEATRLLQSAYDQCLADGNISDTDVVEIEYHVYSTDSANQKMVDYIEDAMLAAAQGTSLEGRIRFRLVEDQDYYTTMQNGQDDMINGAWGGAEMDPYSMMICWTDPSYIMEYGFDPYQSLTLSVQGTDVTMSYYDWYNELYNGAYAIAELDVRNEILAGMEKGLLLNYHMIPIFSSCGAALASHRVVYGSEDYINSIVGRGGIQFMTYTMDDAQWADYCAAQNNQLSY